LVQCHESELGGPVDGNEEIQLAFSRLNLSNINVEVAERVGFELRPRRFVALDLGETRDVMALQAAVQRGSRQMRERRLKCIEAFCATNDPPDRLLNA